MINLNAHIVVDKDGDPQGLDSNSGGYPFKAFGLSSVHFWPNKEQADHYAETLNGSRSMPGADKGYRVKAVELVINPV